MTMAISSNPFEAYLNAMQSGAVNSPILRASKSNPFAERTTFSTPTEMSFRPFAERSAAELSPQDAAAARVGQTYANYQAQAQALGADDTMGDGGVGVLSEALSWLDRPKSAVVGALSGAVGLDDNNGDNTDDGAFDRFLAGLGGRRYGAGDFGALRMEDDDSLLEKAGKGIAAFGVDVALDPLTYVTFGTGGIAKSAAAGLVRNAVKDAVLAEGDDVAATLATRFGPDLLQSMGRNAADDTVDTFVGRSGEILGRAGSTLAEEATTRGLPFERVQAAQLFADGAAAALEKGRLDGGLVGYLQRSGLAPEVQERIFAALPREARNGVKLSAPFLRRDAEGNLSAALPFTRRDERILTSFGGSTLATGNNLLGSATLGKVAERASAVKGAVRSSSIFRRVADSIGGTYGQVYGEAIQSLYGAAGKGVESDVAGALSYGRYLAFRQVATSRQLIVQGLNQQAQIAIADAKAQLDQASDPAVVDRFKFYIDNPSEVEAVLNNADAPLLERSAAGAARSLIGQRDDLFAQAEALGIARSDIDDLVENGYRERVLTREGRQQERGRSYSSGRNAAGQPESVTNTRTTGFSPVDLGDGRVGFEALTPTQINERAGAELLVTDPFESFAVYADVMSNAIASKRFVNLLTGRGVVGQGDWGTRIIGNERDFASMVTAYQSASEMERAANTAAQVGADPESLRQLQDRARRLAASDESVRAAVLGINDLPAEERNAAMDAVVRMIHSAAGLHRLRLDRSVLRDLSPEELRTLGTPLNRGIPDPAQLPLFNVDDIVVASNEALVRDKLNALGQAVRNQTTRLRDEAKPLKGSYDATVLNRRADEIAAEYRTITGLFNQRNALDPNDVDGRARLLDEVTQRIHDMARVADDRGRVLSDDTLENLTTVERLNLSRGSTVGDVAGVGPQAETMLANGLDRIGSGGDAIVAPRTRLPDGAEMLFGPPALREAVERMYAVANNPNAAQNLIDAWYKPYYTLFKTWATLGRGPGYHVRNIIGAAWNNYLGGVEADDYRLVSKILWTEHKAAAQAAAEGLSEQQARAAMDAAVKETFAGVSVGGTDAYQLYKTMDAQGLALQSQLLEAAPQAAADGTVLDAVLSGKGIRRNVTGRRGADLGPAGKAVNVAGDNWWIRLNADWAQRSERVFRSAAFVHGAKRVGVADNGQAARDFSNALQFDYGDLSQLEETLRLVVPFYTWARRNIPLQVRGLMLQPGKFVKLDRLQEQAQNVTATEDSEQMDAVLPEWMRNKLGFVTGIPTGPGGINPLVINAESPALDINQYFKIGRDGVPYLDTKQAISSLSPAIKTPYELAAGVNTTTGATYDGATTAAPAWAKLIPGLTFTNSDGETVMDLAKYDAVRNLLPPVGQVDRVAMPLVDLATGAAPGEGLASDSSRERLWSSLGSFVGAPLATFTDSQVTGEMLTRNKRLAAEIDRTAGALGIDPAWLRDQMSSGATVDEIALRISYGQGRR